MDVLEELSLFYRDYKDEKGYIGFTDFGTPIPYFAVHKTAFPTIIVQYSIHAREYITTYLALKQIKDYILHGKRGTVYFIPALNPDGIKICLQGSPLYKANGKGVDLNVNFDALWGTGDSNSKIKGQGDYIGTHPFSESETKAIREFTLAVRPNLTISYHSKGEEIYYEFNKTGRVLDLSYKCAKAVARVTGYKVKKIKGSAGGYKDWCIYRLNVPSLTIEVGEDSLSHPIGKDYLNGIYEKNRQVLKVLTEKRSLWK